MPPIGSITPFTCPRINPPPGIETIPSHYMDALSRHLGTQLIIQQTRGFADATQERASEVTHLEFNEDLASGCTFLHIRLMRDGKGELRLNRITLRPERDKLDMLFRGVATAALAAVDWKANAPAASSADTQALRRKILLGTATTGEAASQPRRIHSISLMDADDSNADFTTEEAGAGLSGSAIETEPRPPSVGPAPREALARMNGHTARMRMLSGRRPHVATQACSTTSAKLAAELAALPVPHIQSSPIEHRSPGATAPIPRHIDTTLRNAGFPEFQAAAALCDKTRTDLATHVAAIEKRIERSMEKDRDCLRDETSLIAVDMLETEPEAEWRTAAPCRQSKRRLSNASAECLPPRKRQENTHGFNR